MTEIKYLSEYLTQTIDGNCPTCGENEWRLEVTRDWSKIVGAQCCHCGMLVEAE